MRLSMLIIKVYSRLRAVLHLDHIDGGRETGKILKKMNVSENHNFLCKSILKG